MRKLRVYVADKQGAEWTQLVRSSQHQRTATASHHAKVQKESFQNSAQHDLQWLSKRKRHLYQKKIDEIDYITVCIQV